MVTLHGRTFRVRSSLGCVSSFALVDGPQFARANDRTVVSIVAGLRVGDEVEIAYSGTRDDVAVRVERLS